MQVAARIHRAFAASPDATDAPNYPSGPTCQVVLERMRMRMRFARFVRRPLTAPRLLAGAAPNRHPHGRLTASGVWTVGSNRSRARRGRVRTDDGREYGGDADTDGLIDGFLRPLTAGSDRSPSVVALAGQKLRTRLGQLNAVLSQQTYQPPVQTTDLVDRLGRGSPVLP